MDMNQKTTLILGGGGMKASLFHIGACLALQEKGFSFISGKKNATSKKKEDSGPYIDTYVGLSAGALIAVALANGYSLAQVATTIFEKKHKFWSEFFLDYPANPLPTTSVRQIFSLKAMTAAKATLKFSKIFNFSSWLSSMSELSDSLRGGILDSKGIQNLVKDINQIENFTSYKAKLFVVSTQLNQLQRVIFGPEDHVDKDINTIYTSQVKVSEAIAAGVALPPLFAPYYVEGFDKKEENCYFYDGCILDYSGMDIALRNTPDIIVNCSPMTSFKSKTKEDNLYNKGMFSLCLQAISQIIDNRYLRQLHREKNKIEIFEYMKKKLNTFNIDEKEKTAFLKQMSKKMNLRPKMPVCINAEIEDNDLILKNLFLLRTDDKIRSVREGYTQTLKKLDSSLNKKVFKQANLTEQT